MIAWIKQILKPLDVDSATDTHTGSNTFAIRYAIVGSIFGLIFPVFAISILLWTYQLPFRLTTLVGLLRAEPLLWIITTAPLFLGLFAGIAGLREDKLRQAYILLKQDKQEMVQLKNLAQQLEQRTAQLDTITKISQQLSVIFDLDELLAEVVNQIQQNFGYYHAHIYLLDQVGQNLTVVAGTGPAGADLKAGGHTILLSAPRSLVVRAAQTGQIVSVDNVREEEGWLPNPLLPETYAEIAVPITLAGQVVGVLDVQEDEVAGLDESDANLLRSLANQVAVAIRNARFFVEVETALAEAQATQRRYAEQAWAKVTATQRGAEYYYHQPGAQVLNQAVVSKLEKEVQEQTQITVIQADEPGQNLASVVMPIKLQDQMIGMIQLHETDKQRRWSELDLALVQTVAGQVAQAAENLRLFEVTRERAGREQTIREITDKLRGALNLEQLVKIAALELGQRLGATHAELELGIESNSNSDYQ